MNVGEVSRQALQLIGDYSNRGTVTTTSENTDYLFKVNDAINRVQRFIATTNSPIHESITYSLYPIDNLLGDSVGFAMYEHDTTDVNYEGEDATAYYFEVNGNGSVFVEDSDDDGVTWNLLSTISFASTKMTAYSGLITATYSTVRLRFGGSYHYRYQNVALFDKAFYNAAAIPIYKPDVPYVIPYVFEIVGVSLNVDGYKDKEYGNYKFNYTESGVSTFYFPYNLTGELKIDYLKYPTAIPFSATDVTAYNSNNLEISLEAQDALVYRVAYEVLLSDEPEQAGNLRNDFVEMFNFLQDKSESGINFVINETGW